VRETGVMGRFVYHISQFLYHIKGVCLCVTVRDCVCLCVFVCVRVAHQRVYHI